MTIIARKYIYCPYCGSADIEQADYELEDGSEDMDGRRCNGCQWEGDVSELVSKK